MRLLAGLARFRSRRFILASLVLEPQDSLSNTELSVRVGSQARFPRVPERPVAHEGTSVAVGGPGTVCAEEGCRRRRRVRA